MKKIKKSHQRRKPPLFPTIALLIVVGVSSYLVAKIGILDKLLELVDPIHLLPEFIAGLFYSSIFTSPLAIGAFLILGTKTDPLTIALVGGLGAMISDLIILKVIRHFVFGHHSPFSQNEAFVYFVQKIRSVRLFRIFAPLVGGLIIASPFPDEIGLMILGVTRLSTTKLALITYFFNSLGIYMIASIGGLLK